MKKVKLSFGWTRFEELRVTAHQIDKIRLEARNGNSLTLGIDARTLCLDRGRNPIVGVAVGDLVNVVVHQHSKHAQGIQVIVKSEDLDLMCAYEVGRLSPISRQIERSP